MAERDSTSPQGTEMSSINNNNQLNASGSNATATAYTNQLNASGSNANATANTIQLNASGSNNTTPPNTQIPSRTTTEASLTAIQRSLAHNNNESHAVQHPTQLESHNTRRTVEHSPAASSTRRRSHRHTVEHSLAPVSINNESHAVDHSLEPANSNMESNTVEHSLAPVYTNYRNRQVNSTASSVISTDNGLQHMPERTYNAQAIPTSPSDTTMIDILNFSNEISIDDTTINSDSDVADMTQTFPTHIDIHDDSGLGLSPSIDLSRMRSATNIATPQGANEFATPQARARRLQSYLALSSINRTPTLPEVTQAAEPVTTTTVLPEDLQQVATPTAHPRTTRSVYRSRESRLVYVHPRVVAQEAARRIVEPPYTSNAGNRRPLGVRNGAENVPVRRTGAAPTAARTANRAPQRAPAAAATTTRRAAAPPLNPPEVEAELLALRAILDGPEPVHPNIIAGVHDRANAIRRRGHGQQEPPNEALLFMINEEVRNAARGAAFMARETMNPNFIQPPANGRRAAAHRHGQPMLAAVPRTAALNSRRSRPSQGRLTLIRRGPRAPLGPVLVYEGGPSAPVAVAVRSIGADALEPHHMGWLQPLPLQPPRVEKRMREDAMDGPAAKIARLSDDVARYPGHPAYVVTPEMDRHLRALHEEEERERAAAAARKTATESGRATPADREIQRSGSAEPVEATVSDERLDRLYDGIRRYPTDLGIRKADPTVRAPPSSPRQRSFTAFEGRVRNSLRGISRKKEEIQRIEF